LTDINSGVKKATIRRITMLSKIKDKISRVAQRVLGIDGVRHKLDVISSKLDVISSEMADR
jgi:hypothetical protein